MKIIDTSFGPADLGKLTKFRLSEVNLKPIRRVPFAILAIIFLCSCGHLFQAKQPADAKESQVTPNNSGREINDATRQELARIRTNHTLTYPQDGANTDADINSDQAEPEENLTIGSDPLEESDQNLSRSCDPVDKKGQTLLDEALDFCEVAQSFWQKGELENALDALDKAYSLILDVDTQQDDKLFQQKEDLRILISKRILEIYASRNTAVNGNHDEIPLDLNSHVQAELKRFTTNEKEFFRQAYARSGKYRPYILEALRKEGLPEELSWLPLIESGYKVKALSRARALGLWQFIPSTGSKFGLKRNRYIDERMDFIRSTNAAIAYLKELHSIFGDWSTVLAAYNCGEGRVLQVIRTQKVNYLDNFWDLYQRLPNETARYVPRFLATLHMIKNPEKYGISDVVTEPPLDFETFEISRQVHLKDVGNTIGVKSSELETLNPELRYHLVPPETYILRVPKGTTDQLQAAVDTLPVSQLPQRAFAIYHRVGRGQTLSTIARKYHTSVRAIMRANNMRRTTIRAGSKLKIPQRGYMVATHVTSKPATKPSASCHRVRKGDSLYNIAHRYGTTVENIKTLNRLNSDMLVVGQNLKIPGFKPEPLPENNQLSTYSVKNGDSPYTIALKHNMELDRLLMINKLTPRSKIYPGQKLFIE